MEKIGDVLKKKRLDLNISLGQSAEETMIASRYLESIENSDFSPFPGSVYAKGFLRRYAEYLKLEEIEIQRLLSQYKSEQEVESSPQIEKKIDIKDTIIRNVRANKKNLYLYSTIVIIGFLIVGGILGAIIIPFLGREPKIHIDQSKLLSQEEVMRKNMQPEKKQKTKLEIKPVIKGVLLEGNAFEEVWVQIQIDSGKNKEILIKAGEKIKWNAKEKICLTMGNAGAIAWKFNYKAIGTLGKTGIAKTILFTPGKMQTVIKKEQLLPISPKEEEKKVVAPLIENKEKQGTDTIVSFHEQVMKEKNTTQTTGERTKNNNPLTPFSKGE
ncbi:MAG: RodZ domain-containing protein [Candidatus Desantisbacteria bacterium]